MVWTTSISNPVCSPYCHLLTNRIVKMKKRKKSQQKRRGRILFYWRFGKTGCN